MASDDQAKRKESELNQLLDEIRRRAEEAELKRIEEIERKVSGLRTSNALLSSPPSPPIAVPSGSEQKILDLRAKLTDGLDRTGPEKASSLYKEPAHRSPRDPELEITKSRIGGVQPEQQRINAKLFPIRSGVEEKRPTDSPIGPEKVPADEIVDDNVPGSQDFHPPERDSDASVRIVELRDEHQQPETGSNSHVADKHVSRPIIAPRGTEPVPRVRVAGRETPAEHAQEPKRSRRLVWIVFGALVIAIAGYVARTLLLDPKSGLEHEAKTEVPVETTVNPAINDGVNDTTPLNSDLPSVVATSPPISGETSVKMAKPIIPAPAPIPEQRPRQIVSRVQKEEAPAENPRVDKPVVKPIEQPIAGVNEKDLSTAADQPPTDFVAVSKEPVVVKRVEPKYPELAQKLRLEGRVVVRIWVDKNGKPKQVVILKSDNEIFNESATEAAWQFVFTPGYVSTGPVATWVAIPFKFKFSASPIR